MKGKGEFPSLNVKTPNGIRPNGRPYRVMIVENNDFQRKQLVQILESEKYEVAATAMNGKEALEKFEKVDSPIDFITTNLDMPILDGYALMFELNQKQNKPLIIFISDDTTKGVMQDLVSMGIGDFILKPINRRAILERVRAAIKKKGI